MHSGPASSFEQEANFIHCFVSENSPKKYLVLPLQPKDANLNARRRRLSPELALFSGAPRKLDSTVVTAFSTSRLYMLEGMCDSWPGPLSAAVYQGVSEGSKDVLSSVQEAKAAVQELFER